MSERGISILYGMAAGAGLVQLGVPAPVLIPVSIAIGLALEVKKGHSTLRETDE